MIVRIVKLTFKTENIASFKQIFEETKGLIRNFEGCSNLELYQSIDDPGIFFTYSYWGSDDALQAYRQSELFKRVWGRTKILFKEKPRAWSLNKLQKLN